LKTVSVFVSVFLALFLLSCASSPQKADQSVYTPPAKPQKVEKRTPRFAQFADAIEYLGTALNEEIYRLRQSDGFSATVSPGSNNADPLSPEDETRMNADNAMEELEREIAKKEGRAYDEGGSSVTSSESYTESESANMQGAGTGSGKPMVIAIADFVNDDDNVSRLGRYTADKLTPYFARSEQFSVLERSLINKVIEEQQFQVSAFVDESSTQEFGKLLGAETIISGTISQLNDVFYFNAKAVDVTSGKLLTSVDVEIDRTGRLEALYTAPLPKPPKEKSKPRIFRAKGIGVPSSKQTNPTLARTMAARAAQADAMRNLVQEIQGAQVNSQTTVKDYMTESDSVHISVNSYLRGARVINKTEMPDGAVEVEMEVEVPGEFFDSLKKN